MKKIWLGYGFLISWPLLCSVLFIINQNVMIRFLFVALLIYGYITCNIIPKCVPAIMLLFLMPVFYIDITDNVANGYFNYACVTLSTIFNSVSLQHSLLHERMTLWLIVKFGCTPRKITCALMFVSHMLSMFMSNTFTSAVMIPVALKIYEISTVSLSTIGRRELHYFKLAGKPKVKMVHTTTIGTAYVCAIIFGSICGGLTFAKGSPTNITFLLIYKIRFDCYFNTDMWFLFTVPISVLISILACLWIQVVFLGLFNIKYFKSQFNVDDHLVILQRKRLIHGLYKRMGPMTWHQSWIGVILFFCAMLWLFRSPFGYPGWQKFFTESAISNSSINFFVQFIMMMVPIECSCDRLRRKGGYTCGLTSWRLLQKEVNWCDVLLFGGINILGVFHLKCGLAEYFAKKLLFMKHWPLPVVVFVVTFVILWGTELLMNTLICSFTVPILIELGVVLNFHPMSLSFVSCLVCSMAFICPYGSRPLTTVLSFMNYDYKKILLSNLVPKMMAYFILITMYLTFGKLFYGKDLEPGWVYSTDVCYCTPCERDKYIFHNRIPYRSQYLHSSHDFMSI